MCSGGVSVVVNKLCASLYLLIAVILFVTQTACAQLMNQDLSPPPGGETVSVSVKVPKDLAANRMRVMYRSEKCPISRSDGSGGRYEIAGAKMIEIEPQRQGTTDIYEAKLFRDGGGHCEWELSNATFGVRYENTSQFGAGVHYGHGGEVIVIFDSNLPPRQSMDGVAVVDGDLEIKKDYFPWLVEIFLYQPKVSINLLGLQDVYSYRAPKASRIIFVPNVHSKYLVRTVGAQGDEKKSRSKIIYPDGKYTFGGLRPNFYRLMEQVGEK